MKKALVTEGIVFIILGVVAMLFPHFSSLAFELLVGWLLVISGALQIYASLTKKTNLPFFQSLLLAGAYSVVGLFFLFYPKEGLLTLTFLLAILFFLQGLYGIFMSFHASFPPLSKAWLFVSGIISVTLSFFIWKEWYTDSSWILGLFVGANLILLGIAYLVLGKFFSKI